MNIAIDLRALMEGNQSGVETYIKNILNAIFEVDKKNTYILFTARWKKVVLPWKKNERIKYFHYKISSRILNILLFFFRWPKIDRVIEKHTGMKIDLIFVPDLRPTPVSKNVATVCVIHDLAYEHYPHFFSLQSRLWFYLLRPRRELLESKKIIAVSSFTKQDMQQSYGIPSEKIAVVHEGAPDIFRSGNLTQNESEAILTKYGIKKPYFLALSTLEPRKNIKRLVEAYKKFQQKNPENKIKLVLAGKENKKIFATLKIEKNPHVILPGFIDEKDKFAVFANADAFVYPSLFEGFGLPVVEAMVAQVPTITSNRTSLPEVSGDSALLIDPENMEEMVSALEKIQNSRVRKELISKMASRVKTFQWERSAADTIQIFESISPS